MKEIYTDENMPTLARDYFLSIRNAFDATRLMKEKAYSRETKEYTKERENDLQEISFRVVREINNILDKKEIRSILDSI